MHRKFNLIALAFVLSSPAFAQQAADPRLCPAQLNAAETDGGGMLRLVHSLGAQLDLLRADLATVQKQLDEEKAKNAPKDEKKE